MENILIFFATSFEALQILEILHSTDILPRDQGLGSTSQNLFINLCCCDWVWPLRIGQGRGWCVALPPNTAQEALSSPQCVWQDRAQIREHQLEFSCERGFARSLTFMCGICICRLFLVSMTATFNPLQEYHLQLALSHPYHND